MCVVGLCDEVGWVVVDFVYVVDVVEDEIVVCVFDV